MYLYLALQKPSLLYIKIHYVYLTKQGDYLPEILHYSMGALSRLTLLYIAGYHFM